MITQLEIQGYKGLTDIAFDGLKRLTLIGGKNNTGKTSVLEAFFLSLDWGHADLLTRHLQWRGVDAIMQNADSAWGPSFSNFELSRKIMVRTKGDQGTQTFTAQIVNAPTSSASGGGAAGTQNLRTTGQPTLRLSYTKGSRSQFEAKVIITGGVPPYSMKVDKVEGKPPVAFYTTARIRPTAMDEATLFGQLDTQKKAEDVTNALKLLVPGLRNLSVVPMGLQSQLYADIKDLPNKIPVNLLGDGTTRLLSMLLHICSASGGYFLVDEFENGFHYSALPKIWETVYAMCKSNRCQMIATTHSYECLTAYAETLKGVAGDDYSYARVDPFDDGLRVVSYNAEALRNATAGGWEVR